MLLDATLAATAAPHARDVAPGEPLPASRLSPCPWLLLLETSCENKEKQGLSSWSSPGGASLASLSIMLFVTSSLISVDVKPKR